MFIVHLVELLGFGFFDLSVDDVVSVTLGNTAGDLFELEEDLLVGFAGEVLLEFDG